jgi:hypothetical protein
MDASRAAARQCPGVPLGIRADRSRASTKLTMRSRTRIEGTVAIVLTRRQFRMRDSGAIRPIPAPQSALPNLNRGTGPAAIGIKFDPHLVVSHSPPAVLHFTHQHLVLVHE